MLRRRRHAGQVRRIHDQHGVKLEADRRPRLDVLHAGQQQRGQQFLVAHAAADAVGNFFQQSVARRFFEQPHERLDLRLQLHRFLVELGLRCRNRIQFRQER